MPHLASRESAALVALSMVVCASCSLGDASEPHSAVLATGQHCVPDSVADFCAAATVVSSTAGQQAALQLWGYDADLDLEPPFVIVGAIETSNCPAAVQSVTQSGTQLRIELRPDPDACTVDAGSRSFVVGLHPTDPRPTEVLMGDAARELVDP